MFIRLRRRPRLRAVKHFGVQTRPWPWRNALMRDIPFQRSIYYASADFAHRRMTADLLAEQVLWQARALALALRSKLQRPGA